MNDSNNYNNTAPAAGRNRLFVGASRWSLWLCGLLACASLARGQVAVEDGFESGSFAAGWGQTAGVAIPTTGGAKGTTNFAGLGSITPGEWYRLRVSGQDWGTASARWSVDVSAAGGTNFINSATNLTWYQGGTPTANPARYFVFTTVYGINPGVDVDEVTASVVPPPPPVAPAIGLISGIYPHLSITTANQSESGIGAVVPWAGRLWAIHYFAAGFNVDGVQHLWELDDNLNLTGVARPPGGGFEITFP